MRGRDSSRSRAQLNNPKFLFLVVTLLLFVPVLACRDTQPSTLKLAYITNGVASFWTIAEAGVRAAGKELNIDARTYMPAQGLADQKRILEDILARGVDGIAISLIDPSNQIGMVNEAAHQVPLITSDADCPGSDRILYLGMDNYEAGRMVGRMVREAMPQGGTLAIFIGRLEQDNARKRRQGTIDEILGRTPDPKRYDTPGVPLEGAGFSIVGTYTDQFDRTKAKANVEDVISRFPNINGFITLFAYNTPAALEALKQVGKLGKVNVFSFDEAFETLQGIKDGTVVGTVVQDPYRYGYESIKVLASIARKTDPRVPESKMILIPARTITKTNVDSFWSELKANLGGSNPSDPAAG